MIFYKKCMKILSVLFVVALMLGMGGKTCAAKKVDIHILTLLDLTGPYSASHQTVLKGIKAFAEWANETEYIPGVNIVLDVYDHGMDVSKCLVAFNTAASSKNKPVVSTAGISSATAGALKSIAKRKKIPLVDGVSNRSIILDPGWVFGYSPPYEAWLGVSGKWIKANWKADSKFEWIRKHYKDRPPRLGYIGWDNAFGRALVVDENRAYLKSIGVEFLGDEYIPMSPNDVTPQLERLRKADFIYFGMYSADHAVCLKNAARLGLREKFLDISWPADSPYLLKMYAGALSENTLIPTMYQPLMKDWPDFLRESFKKSGLGEPYILGYSWGVVQYDIMFEAIRNAAKAVGAENVTGQDVYNALIKLKDFPAKGVSSKITYSETKRWGPDVTDFYQIVDGKVIHTGERIRLPELIPGGRDVPK